MDQELQLAKVDTTLAKKRTIMAATRTLLSHIRTSLVFISVALAFMKLKKDEPVDIFIILLFILSAIFLILGFIDFYITKHLVKSLNTNFENN